MNVKQLSAKLRHAADVLDDLLGLDRPTVRETSVTADKLRGAMAKGRSKKGFNYHGTHWTQLKKNHAKVLANAKKGAKARRRLRLVS